MKLSLPSNMYIYRSTECRNGCLHWKLHSNQPARRRRPSYASAFSNFYFETSVAGTHHALTCRYVPKKNARSKSQQFSPFATLRATFPFSRYSFLKKRTLFHLRTVLKYLGRAIQSGENRSFTLSFLTKLWQFEVTIIFLFKLIVMEHWLNEKQFIFAKIVTVTRPQNFFWSMFFELLEGNWTINSDKYRGPSWIN